MNFKPHLILFAFLCTSLFLSCSGENSNKEEEEPEVTEHYFFEGKLDNEPFLIEKKLFNNLNDNFTDNDPFSIDYGGTLINCTNKPQNEVYTDCYAIYASGIIIYNNIYPEEYEKHNTAKMYFGRIDVDERIFENELEALSNFFQSNQLGFRRDFGNTKVSGDFAFDFFPPNPDNNNPFYYSSRFSDNSMSNAKITSVEEIDNYFYLITGTVDNCKMYDSREYTDENPSYKLLTDFKFKIKIKADFNYENYKDD